MNIFPYENLQNIFPYKKFCWAPCGGWQAQKNTRAQKILYTRSWRIIDPHGKTFPCFHEGVNYYRYLHGFFKVIFFSPIFFRKPEKLFKRKFVVLLIPKFASVTPLETSLTKFGCNGSCQISIKLEIFDILINFKAQQNALDNN